MTYQHSIDLKSNQTDLLSSDKNQYIKRKKKNK